MEREQIEAIIKKYRRKSEQELRYGEEKCALFDRVADDIEDNIELYLDDDYETEEEIIDDVKEAFAEVDDMLDTMFHRDDDFNDDDDGIGSFLTD
jgi:hypothetical protein